MTFLATPLRLIVGLLFACLFVSCAGPRARFDPSAAHLGKAEVLQYLATQPAGVRFSSRNGRYYGMGSDATILFTSRKRVEVTEYGYAPRDYQGVYSVDSEGAIHVKLKNYSAIWPATYLYPTAKGTFLFPNDKDPAFRLGGRAGGVETSSMAPYWPFRQTK